MIRINNDLAVNNQGTAGVQQGYRKTNRGTPPQNDNMRQKMNKPQQEFSSDEEEIEYLRTQVDALSDNRIKLIKQLEKKKERDAEHFVYLPESDISDFFHKSKCDQKLLAVLYWDSLTERHKEVFTDHEEMQLSKEFERKRQLIMTDPNKMRQHFLMGASPILDDMLSMAKGETTRKSDAFAFREVWEVLKGIITAANSRAPVLDLRGKDVAKQIDEILTSVTAGDLTFDEAKEYMSLVSSGFNLQELPKLMAKLESLEQK